MIIRIHGIKVQFDHPQDKALKLELTNLLAKHGTGFTSFQIARRSVDARKKPVKIVYSLDVELTGKPSPDIAGAMVPPPKTNLHVNKGTSPLIAPPVVVGAGPAGLLAALMLAEHGYRPTLIERGGNIEERIDALKHFSKTRTPNPECNALFGLGGAGTFSDGKLTSSLSHPWISALLRVLVECGAPEEILIDAKPHIGTDVLRSVISKLTERIRKAGGEVRTGVKMTGLILNKGTLTGIETTQGSIEAGALVMAIGQSARDTLEMLSESNLTMEPKPFQIGIRVEHPQAWLDRKQFGDAAGNPILGSADYKLATRINSTPVFSFCMCPGGETIPVANEPGHLCLNGMSNYARNSKFATSGLVVTLTPEEYGGKDLKSCLDFVRKIESKCFEAGGSSYAAPGQDILSFARGQKPTRRLPESSYHFGVTPINLDSVLPKMVTEPLRKSLTIFNRRMPGYLCPESIVLGAETRASCPIRITRDKISRESDSIKNLYPVGEGAGHAGGIISSALDGIMAAKSIIESTYPS